MEQNNYTFEIFNFLTNKERRIKFISQVSQEAEPDDMKNKIIEFY